MQDQWAPRGAYKSFDHYPNPLIQRKPSIFIPIKPHHRNPFNFFSKNFLRISALELEGGKGVGEEEWVWGSEEIGKGTNPI